MYANIVVGLLMVALFAHAVLSLRLQRLQGRVEIVESKGRELARSVASVRAWAGQEIEAMQDEALRGQATVREPVGRAPGGLTHTPAPVLTPVPPDPEEQRTTLVTPAPNEVLQRPLDESGEAGDEDATTVFDPEALRQALRPPPLPPLSEDEATPEGERSTFVTMFRHPEKEGSS